MSELSASIVICTLNRPDDIQHCVASIAEQSLRPTQVIVVDAGDLAGVVNSLQDQCRRTGIEFIYLRDNPSTTAQRNKGASSVNADIVFFLDDDVMLDHDYIETIVGLYTADNEEKIGGITGIAEPAPVASKGFWSLYARCFGLAETRVDCGTLLKRSNFPVHGTRFTADRDSQFMPSTAVSYRKRVFDEHRFDTVLTGYVMAEDIDLSYRVSRHHRLLTTASTRYRHAKSAAGRNTVREHEKRRLLFTQYFFRKNFGGSVLNAAFRTWALCGMSIRYLYLGLKGGDMQKFRGFCDGIAAAYRNGLFRPGRFRPGPLEH